MNKEHLISTAAGLIVALSTLPAPAWGTPFISAGSAHTTGGVEHLAQLDSNQVGSSSRIDSAVNGIDCKKKIQGSSDTWGVPATEAEAECQEIVYQTPNPPMGMTFMQRNRWETNERMILEDYERLRAGTGDSAALNNRIRQLESEQDDIALQRQRAMEWQMNRGLDYPARPLRN